MTTDATMTAPTDASHRSAVAGQVERSVMRGATVAPRRPLVRYHGGKWKLGAWIIRHLPSHRTYVEPFGGGGSVLLQKQRSYAEVYNDMDGEIVNLFRVARDEGEALASACELTPFARDEFDQAYEPVGNPLEQARRTLVRSFMGFGSAGISGQLTGFRSSVTRSYTTPANDWMNYPAHLRAVVQRLRGVVIENRDATDVMRHHDGDDTVHYVDPPYVHSTRGMRTRAPSYRHEMTDQQHRELATNLAGLRGTVVVSGYRCDLYDELFDGWQRIDAAAHADGARDRVESLWLSRGCPQAGLFDTHNVRANLPP
jgi:DNA adenine methylase